MKRHTPLISALVAAGLFGGASANAFGLNPLDWFKSSDEKNNTQQVAAATTPPAATPPVAPSGQVPDYRAIVKKFGPAVVGVTTSGRHVANAEERGMPPGMERDPFFQFFRGLPGFPNGPQGPQPFRGQGSGFIVSSDGLILTNAHVVREARDVTVRLDDRREYTAKVLGTDPVTDVAVLRIEAKDLPTVQLGDPKRLEVGDPVLAIGAPFGFEQTATQGIVSAKGRSLPGDAVVPFIQTDAAVNPGNSGGPLFDAAGNVVGINAQIYSRTGGYQGLAFAIPIDVAMKVKDQIVATGKATHARLGVTVQELNQTLAESFGLKRPGGALVAQVAPDSAAQRAGLKSGDVITEVNGKAVDRSGELSAVIGMSSPGDRVKLKVWRDKKSHDIEATLGAMETEQVAAAGDEQAAGGRLGLSVRPLSGDERRMAGVERGLLVQGVRGAAAEAGVRPGDVLLAINGKPVESIEQVQSTLENKPKSVALLVMRDGDRIFVPVTLG
ncbi:MAG: DegQ family serine endoprotease [Burkholderiaceae bacterium]|nr:DegQ family serine endoprotease [Burkholderiaceae bacterium]